MNTHKTIDFTARVPSRVVAAFSGKRAAPTLVGFHGYAENAMIQFERLAKIGLPFSHNIIAIQGLHAFYNREREVVCSWMTKEQREKAIELNIAFVDEALDEVEKREKISLGPLAILGFSQGTSMAYRAAAFGLRTRTVSSVIAVAGDVPPEITEKQREHLSTVVIARGDTDELYPEKQLQKDRKRLEELGASPAIINFAGAHTWTEHLYKALREKLTDIFGN